LSEIRTLPLLFTYIFDSDAYKSAPKSAGIAALPQNEGCTVTLAVPLLRLLGENSEQCDQMFSPLVYENFKATTVPGL
jgi:hypothetical protein